MKSNEQLKVNRVWIRVGVSMLFLGFLAGCGVVEPKEIIDEVINDQVCQIAFASDRDGDYDIYVMDTDGSDVIQLTFNDSNDMFPAWSPDGGQIAFDSNRDGDDEIYMMGVDGSHVVQLTDNDSGDETPSWSPYGEQVVFSSNLNGDYDIHVMDADGSNAVQLMDKVGWDFFPTWSPACGVK